MFDGSKLSNLISHVRLDFGNELLVRLVALLDKKEGEHRLSTHTFTDIEARVRVTRWKHAAQSSSGQITQHMVGEPLTKCAQQRR